MTSHVEHPTPILRGGWRAYMTMGHMTSKWLLSDTKLTSRMSEQSPWMKEKRYDRLW